MLRESEIREIHEETGFSNSQISRLYSRFTSLDKSCTGLLRREDFLRIPELAINPLGDRVVHAFFISGGQATEEGVNFRQFIKTLARFRPIKNDNQSVNSKENKLQFAFKMYDLDGDEKISRDELLSVLHMMVGSNISEEQLGSIADRTMEEADQDHDGAISFEEFQKVMERVDVNTKLSIRFLS